MLKFCTESSNIRNWIQIKITWLTFLTIFTQKLREKEKYFRELDKKFYLICLELFPIQIAVPKRMKLKLTLNVS